MGCGGRRGKREGEWKKEARRGGKPRRGKGGREGGTKETRLKRETSFCCPLPPISPTIMLSLVE